MLFRNRTTRRARNIDFDQRACTEGAVEARLSASTAGYVKLLLPPRQSRGNSHVGLDTQLLIKDYRQRISMKIRQSPL
jgi:hypothetical protein